MTKQALEWLETNGTGGFLCGTVSGEVTRKWHGWWLARRPPRGRIRLIAGFEEEVDTPAGRFHLTSRWINGTWVPPDVLPEFDIAPLPRWRWTLPGDVRLEKEICLPHLSNALIVHHRIEGSAGGVVLRIRPRLKVATETDIEPPPLDAQCSALIETVAVDAIPAEVDLAADHYCEDVYTEKHDFPVEFQILPGGQRNIRTVFAARGERMPPDAARAMETERQRRLGLPAPRLAPLFERLANPLARAADQFIVLGTDRRPTVIAGYPWFTDWGRDTMISLPGLCLATGRRSEAREIIRHFLSHLSGGLIPNVFPKTHPQAEYNTVDATLWLVEAAFRAWTSGEIAEDDALYSRLREILEFYEAGTFNDIRMAPDGLISAGTPGTQLTWMDIKIDGHVPTPRHGKPIEIHGLWFNALRLMAGAACTRGDRHACDHWKELSARVQASFARRYITEDGRIADVIDRDCDGSADYALRANKVLPFALHHNVIPPQWRPVLLRRAAAKLVTPSGLRSLAPDHPQYIGLYVGNVQKRDRAYHQGTVWFWLIMPYLKGVYKERENVPELLAQVPRLLESLVRHFRHEACMEQVSEIADGDAPHQPRGCFAQAWSVAALIEVLTLPWPAPPSAATASTSSSNRSDSPRR